jgi:Domain of unknown function (DUF1906)
VRFGVDYANGSMSANALRGLGADFVCRYMSYPGASKNMSASEALNLSRAGIDIVLVFETSDDRTLMGHAGGSADAASAEQQAARVGMPAGRPIYFALDCDAASQPQAPLTDYISGVASVLGVHRTGAYGGYSVIRSLFDAALIAWGWQTHAGSGGKWDSRAQIRQFSSWHTVGDVECDYDHGLGDDFGQWRAQPQPAEPPAESDLAGLVPRT